MEKELITIITPVYNRAHLIENLYFSLQKQEKKNFCWMIVDDGSDDEIEEIIKKTIELADFSIYFYKKKNGGKHTALNLAFSKLFTELAFVVDSDDVLSMNATLLIEKVWNQYKGEKIAGIVFLRGYNEADSIGSSNLKDGIYNMIEVEYTHRITGDKAEVFRSDILKTLRFPEFPNEKFIGEGYLWNQIYLKYKMIYLNRIIYICKYLENGLTSQGRYLRISCPMGGMEYSKVCFNKKFPLFIRIKRALLYVCYGKFAGLKMREIVGKSDHSCLVYSVYGVGFILYLYWKKKYMHNWRKEKCTY